MSILYWEACAYPPGAAVRNRPRPDLAHPSPAAHRLVECRGQDGVTFGVSEWKRRARQGASRRTLWVVIGRLQTLHCSIDALRIGRRLLPRRSPGKHASTLVGLVRLKPRPGANRSAFSASAWNQIECIRILLDFGCPPGVRNNQGFTALEYAYSATLAREFQDAIRETYEGKRTFQQRRNEGSFTSVDPPSSAIMQVDTRGLRYRPSYGTLFSDDASTSGSYTGRAGRLGYGYQPPGTPQHLHIATATTPEPKSPGSTFSYTSDTAGGNNNNGSTVGLGIGRVGSSSGTQSPMHRQVSQRAYNQNAAAGANHELVSPGTASPRAFPRGTSPPAPSPSRRLSNTSLTSTPPAMPRHQSGLQVPEVPSLTTGRGVRPGELVRPVSLLRQASSGNRSPSAISPTNTGGTASSQWSSLPPPFPPAPRGYSASEVMARTDSVRSAMESPSRKASLGIPPALTRRESSPSVIEYPPAVPFNTSGPPTLGPPV